MTLINYQARQTLQLMLTHPPGTWFTAIPIPRHLHRTLTDQGVTAIKVPSPLTLVTLHQHHCLTPTPQPDFYTCNHTEASRTLHHTIATLTTPPPTQPPDRHTLKTFTQLHHHHHNQPPNQTTLYHGTTLPGTMRTHPLLQHPTTRLKRISGPQPLTQLHAWGVLHPVIAYEYGHIYQYQPAEAAWYATQHNIQPLP